MANGDRFRFQRISFVVLNLDKMRINARDTTDKVVRLCSGLQSTKELWNRHSISIQKRAESGRTVKTACVTIIVIMVSMIGDWITCMCMCVYVCVCFCAYWTSTGKKSRGRWKILCYTTTRFQYITWQLKQTRKKKTKEQTNKHRIIACVLYIHDTRALHIVVRETHNVGTQRSEINDFFFLSFFF